MIAPAPIPNPFPREQQTNNSFGFNSFNLFSISFYSSSIFSKKWDYHNLKTYFVAYSYNFCWPVRTLRKKVSEKKYLQQTPAMAAKLTDHVWELREWLEMSFVQRG